MRVYTYVCTQSRPISTNPGSMDEECEYGLTSGTWFTVRRLEVVAVAGLLWIYCVVCLVGSRFFFRFLYFERTRPTTSTRQPCLMHLSTCTGVRTECHYLICLSAFVCVTFVVFTECESCTRPISTSMCNIVRDRNHDNMEDGVGAG